MPRFRGSIELLLFACCLLVLWFLFWPRYRFLIRIEDGRARVTRGKVTQAFLEDVEMMCRDFSIGTGWIGGAPWGRRASLRFSWNVPRPVRQRLRNLWNLHQG